MSRVVAFCLLIGVLLSGAELAAADLLDVSSRGITPVFFGLILLATGTLAALGHVCGSLTNRVRQRSAARARGVAGNGIKMTERGATVRDRLLATGLAND
jgi:hypothetical protein